MNLSTGASLEYQNTASHLQMHPTRLAVHSSQPLETGVRVIDGLLTVGRVNVSLLWQGLVSVNRH